jgi:hypothetical protein
VYASIFKKWLEAFVFDFLHSRELRTCLMDSSVCLYDGLQGRVLAGMEYFGTGFIMHYVLSMDGGIISVTQSCQVHNLFE